MLLSAGADAGLVTSVPAGVTEVVVLLCPDIDTCGEEMWFLVDQDRYLRSSVLLLDSILEADSGNWQAGRRQDEAFAAALERARGEARAGRWSTVDAAISDAEQALKSWDGPVENQALFDLYYLRGASRLAQGGEPGISFEQAAAAAWNRSVAPTLEAPSAVAAYYAAVDALVAQESCVLRLEASLPGTRYALDGVPLGAGPLELRVLPGRHRLTAEQADTPFRWKQDLVLPAGRERSARASFTRVADSAWVLAQALAALESGELAPPVGDLLSAWAVRSNVHAIELVEVRPKGGRPAVGAVPAAAGVAHANDYDLVRARYEPRSRRFTRG
jgi:hypothetical protein